MDNTMDNTMDNGRDGGRDDGLTLGDALKLAGLAATGGQAKLMIQSGQVKVNGEVETRRKRKVGPGDVIEALGEEFEVEREAG